MLQRLATPVKDKLISYKDFDFILRILTFFSMLPCAVAWGSYFEHAKAWEKRMGDPNVMVVTYEELKEVELTLMVTEDN